MDSVDIYIKNLIKTNLCVETSLDCTDSIPRTRRRLQHISCIKPQDSRKRAAYELVLNYAFRAEALCPGAGTILLTDYVGLKRNKLESKIRNKKDVRSLLRSIVSSDQAYGILCEVLENARTTTKLAVKKSTGGKTHIEISEGYNFALKPLFKTASVELSASKVACIDGYIESVSEIHHLMTHFAETKTPCLLFARGMSDDVLHTLKVNMDRKTALVFPFLVPFDPENVNTIVDIAVVSGTDVVSSTKGELISSITPEKLGSVESAIIGISLRIRNGKTRKRVFEHVTTLKNLRTERTDIESILNARISSLTSSCIDVCIPDDMDFYSTSQQIDEGLRTISSIMNKSYDPEEVVERLLRSLRETQEASSSVFLL